MNLIPLLFAAQIVIHTEQEIDPTLLHPMQQAAALMETGQYSLAEEFYLYLLQGSLKPWERAIVMDNYAAVLLAEGKEDLALSTLQAIPLDPSIEVWLRPRIARQQALAYLQKASKGDPLKSSEALAQAKNETEVAQTTYCNLAEREGYASCPSHHKLEVLPLAIDNVRAQAYQRAWEKRIEKASYSGSVSMLLDGVEKVQSDVSFLQNVPSEDNLQERYRKVQESQIEKANPLWHALKKQLPKKQDSDLEKKRFALYEEATKSFAKSVQALKAGELEKSTEALKATTETLKALKAMPPPPPPPAPQEAPEKAPEAPSPPTKEMDQTLQQLVELERDDMRPPTPVVPTQKVARPW